MAGRAAVALGGAVTRTGLALAAIAAAAAALCGCGRLSGGEPTMTAEAHGVCVQIPRSWESRPSPEHGGALAIDNRTVLAPNVGVRRFEFLIYDAGPAAAARATPMLSAEAGLKLEKTIRLSSGLSADVYRSAGDGRPDSARLEYRVAGADGDLFIATGVPDGPQVREQVERILATVGPAPLKR